MPPWVLLRSRVPVLWLAPLLVAGVVAAPGAAAAAAAETAFPLALHQHASLSEGLGSMEWHTDRALQTGVVAGIWWTDHDWRVDHWNHTQRFDFEGATIDSLFRITETDDAYPSETRSWVVRDTTAVTWNVELSDTLAFEGSRSVRLFASVAGGGNGAFRGLHLGQTSSRSQNRYGLSKRIVLSLSAFPENLDNSFTRFVVGVRLSDHPGQAHTLRYVAGAMAGEPASTIALPWTNGQWNTWNLDVTADAIAQFTAGGADTLRGEDNNLYEVTIGVETRRQVNEPVVFVDDYRINSDPAKNGAALVQKTGEMAAYYEAMYPGVSQFVGTEISRYRAQPHLNGYSPSLTLVDYSGTVFSDSIFYAVDQIHAQGGAVSLNHAFGTDVYGDTTNIPARVLAKKRDLLGSRAYGCDLLEVGYRSRQGIDLAGFLDTWDTLTGNALILTGHGVSDSHGADFLDGWGPWQPGNPNFENNFVTWLWAAALDETSLIGAMKAGRAFFGDPFVFSPGGTLDLVTAEGFPMGRTVVTDRTSHDVVLDIQGLPATAVVRLLQGEVRENPPTEYVNIQVLRDEILPGAVVGGAFTDTVTIDTTLPSFVRFEVDDQGTATVFSNPIVFLDAVPATGVPGPRVAAAVGDVRVNRAAEFTLTGLSFTGGGSPVLQIQGDEAVPGLGELEIDTGVLGPPALVTGGGFTSTQYQGGILTLVGFTGSGSTVEVQWGATPAPVAAERPGRLALGTARPNPFGPGNVVELTMPRAATAFLEVLDVTGRRVRLLLDDRRDAGLHRIAWDGRDDYGRPVANGVYFFRVTSQGESITTKAVRLR